MGVCTPPCCAIFSITGMVFLAIMGVVISANPLYIKGIKDAEEASSTCYKGAATYACTLLISVVLIVKNKSTSEARGNGREGRSGGIRSSEIDTLLAAGGKSQIPKYGSHENSPKFE